MAGLRIVVVAVIVALVVEDVLPCSLRGHKNVPPAVSRSGSSGPEDPTSVQRNQQPATAATGPPSEHTIPSNWPSTTIPHHNHHQFPVAHGSDPGLLYPYMPYPPPSHPRPPTVKPGHPGGSAALDQQLRSVFLKELIPSPSPSPTATAAAAKPVPSVIADHENAKYAAIAELLFKVFGSAPDVFEPLPLPPSPAGPPTEIPISKFDCDQIERLNLQLNSLLLSMPGSPSNAAPSPATPPATLPADVPQPPPSAALLPETGPAAAAAPAPAPVATAVAPAPVADPVAAAAAPTSAGPPPPEPIAATAAPVQNVAQDTAPAAPTALPAVPVQPATS